MYNPELLRTVSLYKRLYELGVLEAIQRGEAIEVYSFRDEKWIDCPHPNFGIFPALCYRVKNE